MLKVNDMVKVHIPDGNKIFARGVYKYNGQLAKVKRIKKTSGKAGIERIVYVELEGCNAPTGLPYGFCADWIYKIEG